MSNTVSQPTALRLKAAGWEGETHTVLVLTPGNNWVPYCKLYITPNWVRWLRAPNISEIRERLTKVNLRDYWFAVIRLGRIGGNRTLHEAEYSEWLYTVTASADLLAEVWIWTRRNP